MLGLITSALVFEKGYLLRLTVLDVTDGEVGTLLDHSLERTLFLFYAIEQLTSEVNGQDVVPKLVNGIFQGARLLDLVVLGLTDIARQRSASCSKGIISDIREPS